MGEGTGWERDEVKAKPEFWRYGVWCTDYRGQQCRGKDLASTYVLHPHQRTRLSLILEETSRGDTRGLYCQGEIDRKGWGTKGARVATITS